MAVVDLRDTGKPMPRDERITPFLGQFAIATTVIDNADDAALLFGPFPSENVYLSKLEVYFTDMDSGTALVWDFGVGDVDGAVDTVVISAGTAGQAAGGDSLDAANIGQDVSGKYLIFDTTTAAGTAVAGTLSVYGEYVNALKHNVD